MLDIAIKIFELIAIPVIILIGFTVAEQLIEPVSFRLRLLKSSWDVQVFAVGAQCSFLFERSFHGNTNEILWAGTCLLFILISAGLLIAIRLKHQQNSPTPDDAFHAIWLGLLSLCIPVEYMVLLFQ